MPEGSDTSTRQGAEAEAAAAARAGRARARRLFWMTQARIWHWMTGAATLVGMLLFVVTGITLNHAGQIEGQPVIVEQTSIMPPDLLAQLGDAPATGELALLPAPVVAWLEAETGAQVSRRAAEWSEREVYVGMPKPGGDAWLSIDRATGDVVFENTDRGAIAWLNDLHKGRNTGPVWFWFIDIFSAAAILFCLTGLVLLWMHAPRRAPTWFIVGAGLIVPAMIAVFLIHV